MNWLVYLLRVLPAIPGIVQHIEQIHGDAKSGAEKKQLALEALQLADSTAQAVAPEQQAAIDAANQLASDVIDGSVAVMKAAQPAPPAVAARVSNVK